MSQTTETIKVKPWGADQGDYVLINAADFDAATHERYEEPSGEGEATTTEQATAAPAKRTRKAKDGDITEQAAAGSGE